MTQRLPEDVPDPQCDPQCDPYPTEDGVQLDLWITVMEFAGPGPGGPFSVSDVEAILGYLVEWHPEGLWSPDRYAIQLHMPAGRSDQAVRLALAFVGDALRAAGLPPTPLIRVEVLTVEELERSWQEYDPTGSTLEAPPVVGRVSRDLYHATRHLLGASTESELADALAGFVTAVGGRVVPGPPRRRAGTTDIDISIEGDRTRHASADAFSMAGLMIESSLPALLADARRALARLGAPEATVDPSRMFGAVQPGRRLQD